MLEFLRKHASGWVAKILLGLLVISFAVWGIEDVFRGYRQGELAKVGSMTVSNSEFETAFRREIDNASQQFGRRLTQEQARMFGLDQRVLTNLVGSATLDNHAAELGMSLPQEKIVEDVRNTPEFQGLGGQFDPATFDQFLRQFGLTERSYVDLRRKEMLRTQLSATLLVGLTPPDTILELLHIYRNERRVIEHFEVSSNVLPAIPAPSDEQLKAFYEARKTTFKSPEYRKLQLLMATTDALKDRISVSDDDVKKTYEAGKESYNVIERRSIQQLAFKSREDAQKARQEIASGKTFLDVAKSNGAKEDDINLGLLRKSDLIDPKIADAAFSLKKDAVSDPVEGRFTFVLLRVTDIQPGVVRTYEDVKDGIREQLQRDRARQEAQKAHDKVDELRISGKSLKEISDELKLKFTEVAAIDRSGKSPDGKPALEIPDLPAVITAAFQSEVGLENESIQTADGGYLWFDVLAITAERQKSFDEVKDEVGKLWHANEHQKAMTEFANGLVKKAEGGATMAELAKLAGGKVATSEPVRRIDQGGGVSQRTIVRAFSLGPGQVASVPTDNGTSRVVLRVAKIEPPKQASAIEQAGLVEQLQQDMRTDTIASYVAALQKRYPVNINQQVFNRLTGRTTDTSQQ